MMPEERLNRIEALLERNAEQIGAFGKEIEKQNEGIRGLIVIGRTCLDSISEQREVQQKDHEEWSGRMNELREERQKAQAATDEKLNILIETVDRIIRHRNAQQ